MNKLCASHNSAQTDLIIKQNSNQDCDIIKKLGSSKRAGGACDRI